MSAPLARQLFAGFLGTAPASLPGFVVAQAVGLLAGVAILLALYPHAGVAADDVVVPALPGMDVSSAKANRKRSSHA